GPALGTNYTYNVPLNLTMLSPPQGAINIYEIRDHGTDVLGGTRGPQPTPPEYRGRADWQHQQEIIEGLYFTGQIAYVSDMNFLEEYYKQQWDTGQNHETFVNLAWNWRNIGAQGLVEYRLSRPWIEETQWLPRVDGEVMGQSFLDMFVYNAHGSV